VHLKLTETGNRLLNEIFQETRTWMSGRLASLTPAQMDKIIEALGLLKNAMEGEQL
jgi:DNA-binding MarR family transcriptional regulator